jgi:DNA-binding CsgD family transcriptional regulator
MTEAEQFAAQYAARATVREIADEARVSHSYVVRHLHAMSAPMRQVAKRCEWHDRVAPLRAQGLSCGLIAERLGVSRNSVERVVWRKRAEMSA